MTSCSMVSFTALAVKFSTSAASLPLLYAWALSGEYAVWKTDPEDLPDPDLQNPMFPDPDPPAPEQHELPEDCLFRRQVDVVAPGTIDFVCFDPDRPNKACLKLVQVLHKRCDWKENKCYFLHHILHVAIYLMLGVKGILCMKRCAGLWQGTRRS